MKKKIFYGIGIFLGVWAVFIGVMNFLEWRNETKFERNRAKLDKMVEEREKELAEDTLGGKTPQETLAMFIEAVEKGDYDLASKYFVAERQEEWKNELLEIKQSEKIYVFLDPIKEAQKFIGEYSMDNKRFLISEPVFINFIKYPSGNWKIDEI